MDIKFCQEINLQTLKILRAFCKEYGVEFFLDAGTLLGAIRHKGFIPWDDDIDICMTRENFNKFNDLCKSGKLPTPLKYATVYEQGRGKHFLDFVPRIFNTSQIIRTSNRYKNMYGGYFQYPHLDIFIIDEVDDDKENKAFFMQKLVYGFAMSKRYYIDYSQYNIFEKIQVFILSNLGKLLNLKKICYLQQSFATKFNTIDPVITVFYSNYEPKWQYMSVPKECFREAIELPFEDTYMPVPSGYDYILKKLYGNYMKLPPEVQRKPSHENIF